MKRIYVLIIACLMAVSMLFSSACTPKQTDEVKQKQSLFNGGVHLLNYSETNDYLIKDGKTDYKIVIAREHSSYIDDTVTDFKLLFEEATGIDLPVVYDDEVYFDNNSKFISFGKNKIFNETGISTDEYDLDRHGYIIKTFQKSIFITGDYDRGTMYGAYCMLELEFNFDCFSNLGYYIDKNVTEMQLKKYNITDIPDIKNRAAMNSFISNFKFTMNRTRIVGRDSETFVGSASAHTTLYYLPLETYYEEHPEWYTPDKSQLCYTAHGDEKSYALMLDTIMENMIAEWMKPAYKDAYILNFGHMDHGTWCACETCAKAKTDYNGSNAAVVIWMCNDIAERTRQWMESDEGKPYAKDFLILFSAYQHTEVPPTYYDAEEGVYKFVDESVVCDPDVGVMFAPGNLDYQNSLYHEINSPFRERFDAWSAVVEHFNIYRYQVNYNYFLMPYDTFSTQQEFYQYAASKNTYWLFDEGQRNQLGGATGWQVFKNYICSKLQWNVNADLDELTDRFFTHYYGAGGEAMRKFFDEYRIHSRDLIDNFDFTRLNSLYHTCLKPKYWPKQLLDRWVGYIDEALDAIEYLKKVDMVEYQRCYDTITSERISIYFMITSLYGDKGKYPQEYIEQITADMKADMERIGISA